MSKIFKGTFYFVDVNDDFDTIDEFIDRLERDRYINEVNYSPPTLKLRGGSF